MIHLNEKNRHFLLKRNFEPYLGNATTEGFDWENIYNQVSKAIIKAGGEVASHEIDLHFYSLKEWEANLYGSMNGVNCIYTIIWQIDDPEIEEIYIFNSDFDRIGEIDV